VDVELDEPAAQGSSDATNKHVDRQLPNVVPELGSIQRNIVVVQPQISPDAKSCVHDLAWPFVELGQKVQRAHTSACRQKATPEQGSAVKRGSFFNGKQKTSDRSGERARDTCKRSEKSEQSKKACMHLEQLNPFSAVDYNKVNYACKH